MHDAVRGHSYSMSLMLYQLFNRRAYNIQTDLAIMHNHTNEIVKFLQHVLLLSQN